MKILVAVDGSEYSHKALEKAKLLAVALKSDVTILTVVDPLKEVLRVQQKRMKDILREVAFNEGDAILKNASEFFKDFSGTFNTILKEGDPAEQIVLHAEEVNYDFVIMGSRGRGGFSRTLLGSVSDKVVHHINRPIIIIK